MASTKINSSDVVVSFGYTDTPITGVTSLSFPRGLVNFGADFRATSQKSNSEELATNITCPLDRPEKFRWAVNRIGNIYTNTGVSASVQGPNKTGVNLLCQVSEVASCTAPTIDPSFRVDLPMSAHIVLKVPTTEYISEQHILALIGRLVSGLFETGETDELRLKAALRGALLPKDLA